MNSVNMRSSKMKFLVYGCVICGMVLTVYLLSNTHTKLKTVKGAYDICLQQKDSLLAQLQVVYEQKSRVEKSLQKEKVDHKKTKDDYQDNIRAKLDIDKEKKDAESRYTNLQQEHQVLQDKYGQLQEKSNQLEENLRKYQTEAENLALNKDNEIKNLNGKLSSLVLSNEQLKQNYDNQAKDFAELNEKLNSLQVLNSQLLEKAQAQQNDIKNDINNNNNNNNADVAKESNAVADTNNNNKQVDNPKSTSPSESPQLVKQPQPNQGNSDGVVNDAPIGDNANANASQINNGANPVGDGGSKIGAGAGEGGGVVNNNPNDKIESNDINKAEESKMQVQQPDNQKNSAQTLSKPKVVVSSTVKNTDNQVPLPKPRSDNSVKDDENNNNNNNNNNQVLPQPNNVIQENPIVAEHRDEDGEPVMPQKELGNGVGRWEGNFKRGPQLSPLAGGQPGNHPNEEDDYRGEEGGDDDAAEEEGDNEGLPAGDNKPHEKRFQDHDFEDEADQNHAKEEGHEGVVVQPK